MPKSKPKKKTDSIWSRITVNQFVAAVASLGNRITSLVNETWRLNDNTKKTTSLWGTMINRLNIDDNEETRHSLYNVLHRNRGDMKGFIQRALKRKGDNISEAENGNICESDISIEEDNNSHLHPELSLPLPERPNTRIYQNHRNDNNDNDNDNNPLSQVNEMSFILTPHEWHAVFSYTDKILKAGWKNTFYKKLRNECGITCSLRVRNKHIKRGERKQSCNYFWFDARCKNTCCGRQCVVTLLNEVDFNSSPIFRVRISGKINHNRNVETMSCALTGEERRRVGKRVNEIGPTAVYRERLEAADERLLEEGNNSEVNTIEVIKKAGADYRNSYRLDEDIYRECRILVSAFRAADVDSTDIHGYVQVVGEMPFRVHLFCEKQIEQYAKYCKKEKYSFVHIDATSGVIKRLKNQGPPLLYTMLIKTGDDPANNIPIAHSILTDNTVPSISYFLGNVAHSITNYKNKLILPSFFVIDFSAALMNSILQSFNGENINIHLARCWNVIGAKYNKVQLRSLSFIHLCCCHVIHAIARSFTQANIDKKIRRNLLYIFALILCGNDLEQLYNLLGSLIDIFGNPNEQNAKQKFDKLLSRELSVDEKSATILKDTEKILADAEKDDEFELVDEYLRSSTPIIHQSPFNIEAIRRYPLLKDLLNNKSKMSNNLNSMFSRSIIRVIYRWWAYLPLWTGLLWNFEERYATDCITGVSLSYYPFRYSNAVLESYFRTLKTSVLQKKTRNTPRELIEAVYQSVNVQLKGVKYGITQSSKGRKRRKKDITPVEKHKKGGAKVNRAIYVGVIDKAKRLNEQKKKNDQQPNIETIQESESEDENMSISLSSRSSITSDRANVNIDPIESVEPPQNNSVSSSSTVSSAVSTDYFTNIANDLDRPIPDDQQSNVSTEFGFDENRNMSSIIDTLYKKDKRQRTTTNQSLDQPDVLIDGQVYLWPKYGINNAIFNGQSYNLSSTCSVDSILFALYFIYRTDINIAGEFQTAHSTSVYSTLVETFRIVESQGWDQARIHWLLNFHIISPNNSNNSESISLFGMLDETVLRFLEEPQRFYSKSTCNREDCPAREQTFTCTKIDLFANDTHFEKFDKGFSSKCTAMIKRLDEITETEAKQRKYRQGKTRIHNQRGNKNEYINAWLCDGLKSTSTSTFNNVYPPIILTEIKPLNRRDEEGYESTIVRLRDMKRTLIIGDATYKLRAVIHHKNGHFTTTCIDVDDNFYHFDDMFGVRKGRACTDLMFKNKQKMIFFTSTTTIGTNIINPVSSTQTSHLPLTTLEQLTNFFNSFYAFLFLAFTILSTIIFYAMKCYHNACACKLSWFRIKGIDEQRRRREIQQQRQRVLDELIAKSSAENMLL